MMAVLQLVLRSVRTAQVVFAANTRGALQFSRLLSMLQMSLGSIAPDSDGLKEILSSVVATEGTGLIFRNIESPAQDCNALHVI